MKTIGEILKKNTSVLTNILKKSQNTQNLASVFHSMIDVNLAKHCHLANLNGSELNIIVKNASWATKLRYTIPDIIKTLRTQPEFREVTKIRYSIRHSTQILKPKKTPIKLSHDNEVLWLETIANLKRKAK